MTRFEKLWGILARKYPNLVILHLLANEDGTECSETSAYKIRKPGIYPEENKKEGDKVTLLLLAQGIFEAKYTNISHT
jgi:hypothetical protein